MSFINERVQPEGLTFDDVLLIPAYSEVLPREVSVQTRFSRNIKLNIPIVSAAMDTVTEAPMAIALAREGGIGVIHKNMSIAEQAAHVRRVKRAENGMIYDPVTISKDHTVGDALNLMKENKIGGIPVVDADRKLIGIVTNRDLRFQRDMSRRIEEVMTPGDRLITTHSSELSNASEVLLNCKIEKLPVVDDEGHLVGLITYKDITKVQDHPNACKDAKGRLRVAAGVGITPDALDRVKALVEEDVDAVVLDSAHGHSKNILDAVSAIKGAFPDCQLVAGNVATYAIEKAWQLGAKPVTCSDSTGWIYDPDGIDVATLIDVKQVRRARLTEYAKARPNSVYHEGKGVWTVKCDVALPCATQNELLLDDAKALVANGCFAVAEGANMPTSLDATAYLQEHGILFCPGKASNAGGVATSALEMTQNSERLSWTFEEVDAKLKTIMVNIFHNLDNAAKEYGMEGNYVAGANIAGFLKVADAMTAQGIV